MPQVGDKHFPYTKAGESAAKKAGAKAGKPVFNKFKKGGKGAGKLSAFMNMKKGKK